MSAAPLALSVKDKGLIDSYMGSCMMAYIKEIKFVGVKLTSSTYTYKQSQVKKAWVLPCLGNLCAAQRLTTLPHKFVGEWTAEPFSKNPQFPSVLLLP